MRTRRSQSSSDPVLSDSLPGQAGHRLSNAADSRHKSVLLHEAIEALSLVPGDVVLDATLGGAGHATHIANKLGKEGILIGFDLDSDAIDRSRRALEGVNPKVHLVEANFRDLAKKLDVLGIHKITKALFDLGWSSDQLDSGLTGQGLPGQGRGFSFRKDEPLLMTYSSEPDANTLTAERIVNEWGESSIADVLWGWGEERYARRIARAIAEARTRASILTSKQLADIIAAAVPAAYRKGRIHPATRAFQALRIAVNDELSALIQGLTSAWQRIAPQGRIAVITFHSIEDRIVKQMFREWEKRGEGQRIDKKPKVPTAEEVHENPRARSAKLRAIQKLKQANVLQTTFH